MFKKLLINMKKYEYEKKCLGKQYLVYIRACSSITQSLLRLFMRKLKKKKLFMKLSSEIAMVLPIDASLNPHILQANSLHKL